MGATKERVKMFTQSPKDNERVTFQYEIMDTHVFSKLKALLQKLLLPYQGPQVNSLPDNQD